MRKIWMFLLTAVVAVFGVYALAAPAWADGENCVETSILGDEGKYCDDNSDGSGIFMILGIIVNVLTMGVGVLGTLGIIIAGVQYLTASGNEAQMAKAKQRIIEVVIGLVIFGVMWAVLQFIIPGGVFGK